MKPPSMKNLFLSLFTLVVFCSVSMGQGNSADTMRDDNTETTKDLKAQANNPLANMIAINVQNYYTPKFTDAPSDNYGNTHWWRFVYPFAKGRMLVRASIPLNTVGVYDTASQSVSSAGGLGDINAFVSIIL